MQQVYLRLAKGDYRLLAVLACAAVLAVLAILAILAVLAAENIANRHVRMLRYRLANILAKAKRVVNNATTTAEDGAADVAARLDQVLDRGIYAAEDTL